MDRVLLYIWLNRIKGIGPVLASNLLNYFGDIIDIYSSDVSELLKVDGIGKKIAKEIILSKDLDESKRVIDKCNRLNIKIVTKESINYPSQLKEEPRSPFVLYVKGNLKPFELAVAIVGSRRGSDYGKSVTVELAEALCLKNIPIISGMAKGIDSYAHTVSVNNNNYTIAVVGTGVDICYPSEHIKLMNKIIENGAVISQFEPGTSNVKANFLKRNELIAMLTDKIIVVQASKDSGALYTAKCGFKYEKQIYAVPGSIYDKYSEGTNSLIRSGANLYTSPQSIFTGLEITQSKGETKKYSESEEEILGLINKKAISLDGIKAIIGLDDKKILELLFEMEINGAIKQVGGLFNCLS
ncbi:DNA-processing protein DprA [Clostridium gasigenes]|uniref:DNA-protecting protein DprA n=1 Tax=Clostridium gasigenes TaxID=94869 RepID=A0A7X0SED9_9CLOT|nr:DNA-processing protein DprA [Clostridium gasigenes]MBB6714803.1 DNA-protecting protein DprA [Clostridium gasigenes]